MNYFFCLVLASSEEGINCLGRLGGCDFCHRTRDFVQDPGAGKLLGQ